MSASEPAPKRRYGLATVLLAGALGIIVGIFAGGYMTFKVYTGVTPTVRDTLVQRSAMREALVVAPANAPAAEQPSPAETGP